MNSAAIALLLLALCAPARAKEIGRLTSTNGLVLVFRVSPVGNLVYHLNCLADIGSCTKDVYQGFWNGQGWSPRDADAVARWGELMRKYNKDAESDQPPSRAPVPIRIGTVDLLEKIRNAGFGAESWDEYASGLSRLMTQADARETIALTSRFRDRFYRWWAEEGRARAEASAGDLKDLAVKKELPEFYAKVARFYGYIPPPGTTVEFDVMSQPRSNVQRSSGEQVRSQSIIETVPEEKAEDRIDVVSHELFHYFYEAAPRGARERLVKGFSDAPQPYAFAAYGLLNEALATALGQGLVSRMVLSPEKFAEMLSEKNRLYADPEINDAAKALIEPLDGWLARGVTIGQAKFLGEYLNAVSAGLGPRVISPRAWFRNVELVYAPELKTAKDRFTALLPSNSVWSYTLDESGERIFFEQHPGLSGALFLRPRDTAVLRSWSGVLGEKAVNDIIDLTARRAGFVYGAKRSDKAYIYVFVGKDAASVSRLVEDFALAPAMFSGLK